MSIVAAPIYKGFVEIARITKRKALANAIYKAQTIYYAENGSWYVSSGDNGGYTTYDTVLNIGARANKYFKTFRSLQSSAYPDAWTSEATADDEDENRMHLYWAQDPAVP